MLSDYIDLNDVETEAHKAYQDCPLSTSSRRGDILEALVRTELKTRYPDAVIEDAERACTNGRKRGRSATSYDFRMNENRVEIKSAQLTWDPYNKYWRANWQNVKD